MPTISYDTIVDMTALQDAIIAALEDENPAVAAQAVRQAIRDAKARVQAALDAERQIQETKPQSHTQQRLAERQVWEKRVPGIAEQQARNAARLAQTPDPSPAREELLAEAAILSRQATEIQAQIGRLSLPHSMENKLVKFAPQPVRHAYKRAGGVVVEGTWSYEVAGPP